MYGEIYTHIYTVYGNTKYEKSFHENNIMTVILLIMVQWGPDIEKIPSASKIERTLTSRAFFLIGVHVQLSIEKKEEVTYV